MRWDSNPVPAERCRPARGHLFGLSHEYRILCSRFFHSLTQVSMSNPWIAPLNNIPLVPHSISCYVHISVTSQSLRADESNLVPRRTNLISPKLSHITKRPLGRLRRRREGNIKLDLQGVGWPGMDWIYLVQDRGRWWALVNAVMNHRVPQNAGNFLTSSEPVSFTRRILLHGVS